MQKIILIIMITLLSASTSFARLGETEEKNESRYGQPVEDNSINFILLEGAVNKTYEYQNWKIRIGYLNGHAVRIAYSKILNAKKTPALKNDEIIAILEAEKNGGKWKKIAGLSLFNQKKTGNKRFDSSQKRWGNSNKSVAYCPIGQMIIYIDAPEATMWEKSIVDENENQRKDNIPKF